MDTLEEQARIFTRYLIRRDVTSQAIQLYKSAVSDSKLNEVDKKLLSFMTAHPRSIGFIDAGLVFHNASSEARRRLYVMLAILEASIDNHDLFLPKNRSPLYVLVVFYSGTRAMIKTAVGLLLVRAVA
jgi:hypothetical protein